MTEYNLGYSPTGGTYDNPSVIEGRKSEGMIHPPLRGQTRPCNGFFFLFYFIFLLPSFSPSISYVFQNPSQDMIPPQHRQHKTSLLFPFLYPPAFLVRFSFQKNTASLSIFIHHPCWNINFFFIMSCLVLARPRTAFVFIWFSLCAQRPFGWPDSFYTFIQGFCQ